MGKYLTEARRHIKKIEHYRNHAGIRGYDQAIDHWNELSDLMLRAQRSRKDSGDASMIHALRESTKPLMDEMEQRKSHRDSDSSP
jgi:hypothetical protein